MSPRAQKPTRRRRVRKESMGFLGSPGFWTVVIILVLLAGFVQLVAASRPQVSGTDLTYDRFIDLAEAGRIKSARVLDADSYVVGRYEKRDDTLGRFNVAFLKTMTSRESLLDVLVENRIPTKIDQQFGKSLVTPATYVLPSLIVVTVFVYLLLSYRRGSGLFATGSGARIAGRAETQTRFRDVAAQETAITELRELAQFLQNPRRFTELGARIPKGVLLYGPPGCGKTLAARALAGESGATFFSISGSDFVEMYTGVGAARVRNLFREARESDPSIIFIDEIDALARRRTATLQGGSTEEQSQALNQLLTEIDGFSPIEGTIVLGATNRPDDLDPALLRPGRFDRTIALDRPNEAGRAAILAVHARGKPLAAETDLASIARRASGMTGADLESVMNEAALLTARAERREISQAELDMAVTRILEAPERQRRLSLRDRAPGQSSLLEERVTFDQVAGVGEALEELQEVKHFLSDPSHFADLGARFPRGFLLVGPPGCGKTLLARAVAGESNAGFISVAATEFTERLVGVGAARVRDVFAEARAVAPAIIFIDEIDAVGARRDSEGGDSHREREQTLNQILIELDGFRQRDGVIVMAATNRLDILDPALVRPGRFDRTITIALPDRDGRREILELHARGKRLADGVDLDAIAGMTRGLSGADLANVMNEATLLSARRGAKEVTMSALDDAIARVTIGISRAHVLTDEERRVVAFHESGHALVARALPHGKLPQKISIISVGQVVGQAWLRDRHDRQVHSRPQLVDEMATLLGGRVAEEIAFGQVSSSAADDLSRVGMMARTMVCQLGMSEAIGPLVYEDTDEHGQPQYSEETARMIDAETRALVDEAETRAREVITTSSEVLERVARALIERETLDADELEELAGPRTAVV